MSIIRVDDTTGAALEVMDEGTILETLIDYFRTAQTSITDFNEGSEARNLLGAVALSQYELYYYIGLLFEMGYVQTAKGDYLDQIGVIVNCYRQTANKASGNVTFTIDDAIATDLVIEAGNVVTCSSNYELTFTTTSDITIVAGQTSASGAITADTGGLAGNVAIGVIDTLEENTTGENITVTNAAALTGGTETEGDEDYRVRILEAGKATAMGNIAWYKSIVNAITGVHDSLVLNTPFDENFTMIIYVNGDSKPTPDALITTVEEAFSTETNMIGGMSLQISKPSYTVQNITADVTIQSGYSFSTVQANIVSNITAYFQGGTTTYENIFPGLNIGDNIIVSVIQMIIGNTEGVQDFTLTSPTSNVVMGSITAAQLGTITITEV